MSWRDVFRVILASCLIFANVSLAFAQGGLGFTPNTSEEQSAEEVAKSEISLKQDEFLERISNELDSSKTNYRQVVRDLNETKTRLDLVGEERLTLTQYIENLEGSIKDTNRKLSTISSQIAERENQIVTIEEDIKVREVALKYQEELLQDYLRLMYVQQNEIMTIDENGEVDAFKLLLTDGSVSENISQLSYYDLLTETGIQLADRLDQMFEELDGTKEKLANESNELDTLRVQIASEKNELELQKESKERLLATTQGQEEIYSQLLEQTQEQQAQYLLEVKSLNDALQFVRRKIDQDGENFNPDDYESLLDYKTKSLYEFQLDSLGDNIEGLNWPVQPTRGISAYFHDDGYRATFGMQHNAIDIPEYQGTPIHAAADGVVYIAKDNGYGYSYIILAHAGGLSTVYGHVSDIMVKEGERVLQGSIIGLTGGMPGTKGAGYMTTGPHLHFEVHRDGKGVDPLLYLPLKILEASFAEAMPEKYYAMWKEQVLIEED